MAKPVMKKVKGHGVTIQLAVWEGGGRSILCIHGITANCRAWDVLASALSPEHRVLAMDLRGRGWSDKPESGYSLEHHVEDIRSLLEELGLKGVVLMGHSLGAFISLAFCAKYPERVERMILIDGGGMLSEEQLEKVFQGIKPALDRLGKVFPSTDTYLETMKQAPYIQPWSPAIETYYRHELEESDGGVRVNIRPENIREEAQNMREVEIASFYPLIACKTLILRATEGLLGQGGLLLPEPAVAMMLEKIPKARRIDIVGTNHYGILFQPNEFRDRAILSFLEDVWLI